MFVAVGKIRHFKSSAIVYLKLITEIWVFNFKFNNHFCVKFINNEEIEKNGWGKQEHKIEKIKK